MFLTRFYLDPRSRAGASALASPQRLHAIIEGALDQGDEPNKSDGRSLWRLDRDDPAAPTLWIVSPSKPDLGKFADQAGKGDDGRPVYQSKDYTQFLERLREGQVFAFRLAANAARSGKRSAESERSQRFGHVTPSQQMAWLEQRSAKHGFSIPPLRSSSRDGGLSSNGFAPNGTDVQGGPAVELDALVSGRHRSVFRRQEGRVTIVTTEFMGHLQVVDAKALRRTLTNGIGHARAYGCGLLTLAAPHH